MIYYVVPAGWLPCYGMQRHASPSSPGLLQNVKRTAASKDRRHTCCLVLSTSELLALGLGMELSKSFQIILYLIMVVQV